MSSTVASPPPQAVLFASAGLAGLVGAAAWFQALMSGASRLGPICGHPAAAALHCPSCYGAAAIALASTGLLAIAADVAGAPKTRRA